MKGRVMKKSVRLLLMVTTVIGLSAAQKHDGFKEMVRAKQMGLDHKTAWLEWVGHLHQEKNSMMTKHIEKWFAFGMDNYRDFSELKSIDKLNDAAHDQAIKALKMHKDNLTEMNNFWKAKCQEGQALYAKQMREIDQLLSNLNL